MKLREGTLRPGKVIEVIDNQGNIRVEAPGLFTREDGDKLPPVKRFPVGACNCYSSLNKYDEVWVLNFNDNPLQLYWLRKDDNNDANKDIQGETNVEILCNRESGMGWAAIYFSDDSGWIIKNDTSKIQIDKDGNITLKMLNAHRCIDINDEGISIGSEGQSAHPATYGDKTAELLSKICNTFKMIQNIAKSNPYTMPIASAIETVGTDWGDDIIGIESTHVTID